MQIVQNWAELHVDRIRQPHLTTTLDLHDAVDGSGGDIPDYGRLLFIKLHFIRNRARRD